MAARFEVMDVAEVFPGYANVFPFDEFNRMQQEALPAVLETDQNLVASAPTASGKTAIAESAICKTIDAGGTALFIAPMRALTNEKEREWERFEEIGQSVYVITGERDLNPRRARHADILVMTPEKVDSATRKHDTSRYGFITDIDLCVIDEVHLLDSDRRGSTLEIVISRLRRLCDPRIIALSATMPNVEEIADWIDAPPEATFKFDDSYRPVELNAGVRTYTHGENTFADKYRRLYRALDLAEPHLNEDGQAIVFVSSRQDTVEATKRARDELAQRDIPIGARGNFDFHQEAEKLDNDTLRKSVLDGVAFHHAGLSKNDRDLIEAWFRKGWIDLIFSTSTLAWGVNLPARCVIIRDTKYHDPLEGELEMSPLDVLQMLGRAGRPGYDDVGYGWVITDRSSADRYRQLLRDGKEIESNLVGDLGEHIVAEVTLGTIADIDEISDWLETTYWYVRAQQGQTDRTLVELQKHVRKKIDQLVADGFIATGDELSLQPTALGQLTSTYYLRLSTALSFKECAESGPDTAAILQTIATATEFDDVTARADETNAIDAVLGSRGDDLADGHQKVLAILRAAMTGTLPTELRSDAWIIKQNALRLLAAFGAFCEEYADPHITNQVRRIEARVEHGVGADAVGLTAIEGVGQTRANTLAAAGIETPQELLNCPTEQLSRVDLSSNILNQLQQTATSLPQIHIKWPSLPATIGSGERAFREVTVSNKGDGVPVEITATVNGVEMSSQETYLTDQTTIPLGIFGSDADVLEYTVTVTVPSLPLPPVSDSRTIDVE